MDTLLISGAVFVLTIGVVFGWGLREPGLIGGGLGAGIGLTSAAIAEWAHEDDGRWWVRLARWIAGELV